MMRTNIAKPDQCRSAPARRPAGQPGGAGEYVTATIAVGSAGVLRYLRRPILP